MNGSFALKIRSKLEGLVSRITGTILSHEEFRKRVNNRAEHILEKSVQDIYNMTNGQNFTSQEDFKELVWPTVSKNLNAINSPTGKAFDDFSRSYQVVLSQNISLKDVIKQEVKHDWYSKLRFLLFRTLTTIFIAGAAIGAAIFANYLGYDMVLIKEKPPKAITADTTKNKPLTELKNKPEIK